MWFGVAPVSAPAGQWTTVTATPRAYTWTKYDMTTRTVLEAAGPGQPVPVGALRQRPRWRRSGPLRHHLRLRRRTVLDGCHADRLAGRRDDVRPRGPRRPGCPSTRRPAVVQAGKEVTVRGPPRHLQRRTDPVRDGDPGAARRPTGGVGEHPRRRRGGRQPRRQADPDQERLLPLAVRGPAARRGRGLGAVRGDGRRRTDDADPPTDPGHPRRPRPRPDPTTPTPTPTLPPPAGPDTPTPTRRRPRRRPEEPTPSARTPRPRRRAPATSRRRPPPRATSASATP